MVAAEGGAQSPHLAPVNASAQPAAVAGSAEVPHVYAFYPQNAEEYHPPEDIHTDGVNYDELANWNEPVPVAQADDAPNAVLLESEACGRLRPVDPVAYDAKASPPRALTPEKLNDGVEDDGAPESTADSTQTVMPLSSSETTATMATPERSALTLAPPPPPSSTLSTEWVDSESPCRPSFLSVLPPWLNSSVGLAKNTAPVPPRTVTFKPGVDVGVAVAGVPHWQTTAPVTPVTTTSAPRLGRPPKSQVLEKGKGTGKETADQEKRRRSEASGSSPSPTPRKRSRSIEFDNDEDASGEDDSEVEVKEKEPSSAGLKIKITIPASYNKNTKKKRLTPPLTKKKFFCEYCRQGFTRRFDMKRHQESVHTDTVVRCPLCDNRGLGRRDAVLRHLQSDGQGHGMNRDAAIKVMDEEERRLLAIPGHLPGNQIINAYPQIRPIQDIEPS
ncbi:hypothetical protein CYLTODRAFT_457415 [Cylindrobasidium torrendii FP15055 ss-10]|uniref:C2H2-type domain-containing protein n=1 Tax=Cylindrobasidium torrendii FP15055 ss-10 TaxID=1314674 RepID=A0A0D7B249_9AGAR|nr:hypothetical protein CYLTODRAFT_457415 [Cylindrobasidium torrendii FP15055 ss-10]